MNNPSPTTMKHLFKIFEGVCSKCGVNRSNKELPCQPSEEKECKWEHNYNPQDGDYQYCLVHNHKGEEKECKFCKTRNLICKCGINCDVFKSHIWNKKPSEKGTEGWEARVDKIPRDEAGLMHLSRHGLKSFIHKEIQAARREVVEKIKREAFPEDELMRKYLDKLK